MSIPKNIILKFKVFKYFKIIGEVNYKQFIVLNEGDILLALIRVDNTRDNYVLITISNVGIIELITIFSHRKLNPNPHEL